MIERTKVKAGIRLSMAVPSVGELYCMPAYPNIWAAVLQDKVRWRENLEYLYLKL